MSKPKYIDVDAYMERHAAYPPDTRITLMMLEHSLKNQESADVIPVEYVRKWFKEHYHSSACALVDDYMNEV